MSNTKNNWKVYIDLFNQKIEVDSNMKKFKLSFKHILIIPVMIGGILLSCTFIPMLYNPMRRSAPMIRNYILRHTPIGMCIEEVIEIIENNEKWGIPSINRASGFAHSMIDATGWPSEELKSGFIIGSKRIQTSAERYSIWGIMERNVRVFWGFDEGGKLIEVNVRSTYATIFS